MRHFFHSRTPLPILGRLLGAAVIFCTTFAPVHAQQGEAADGDLRENPYGTGAGLAIALSNSGFGFGGYFHRSVTMRNSLIAEIQLGAGKDEREEKYFGYFGNSYIPDKANYFLMLPIQLGVQRRLFAESIEDNFRPFVQATAGPTVGWQYPYFRDCDGDGLFDPQAQCADGSAERTYDAFSALFRGSSVFGIGGLVAVGAHFGFSENMTQGIRIGYSFHHFFDAIQLLEPDVENGRQRFFGSPSISLTFGRLF